MRWHRCQVILLLPSLPPSLSFYLHELLDELALAGIGEGVIRGLVMVQLLLHRHLQ